MSEVSLIDGHIDDQPEEEKCSSCMNSRFIVSESGHNPICTLSVKKAVNCITGGETHYIKRPL